MSTGTPRTPPRPAPPTPADVADRAAYDQLVDSALADVRSSAEKWRTGLAALVTVTTTALLVSGPANASDLATPLRYLVVGALAAGLALAVIGLWLALTAASGVPTLSTYHDLRHHYLSVPQYRTHLATKAAKLLNVARWVVAASLAAFLIGMVSWWLAPTGSRVSVVTTDETVCGQLKSGDNQTLRVSVAGESEPRSIPFADVRNVATVSGCD